MMMSKTCYLQGLEVAPGAAHVPSGTKVIGPGMGSVRNSEHKIGRDGDP